MKTITELAEQLNITPQAVYNAKRRAEKEYGPILGTVDKRDGKTKRYSQEEWEKILEYATCKASEPSHNGLETVYKPQVTVETGNHQMVVSTPDLPVAFSLEGLRSTEVTRYDNPLELAMRYKSAGESVVEGMLADVDDRNRRNAETQDAINIIRETNQKIESAAAAYQMVAKLQDSEQNARMQQLQVEAAKLNGLGKPTPGGSGLESP